MRLTVRVKPRAQQPSMTKADDGTFVVAVSDPAVGGKANAAVIKAVAEHFDVAPSRVTLVHGHKSRKKIVDIEGL